MAAGGKRHRGDAQEVPAGDGDFAELLLARAPAEDLQGYEPDMLRRAAALAAKAVAAHRKGGSVVAVEAESGVQRQGRPVSVITVVNDNMPFLFDSVLAEITDGAGEALLVAHPVLEVRRSADGEATVLGDGGSAREAGSDRLSVIHAHVAPLDAGRAAELAGRIERVLGQVRVAVADWRPMLARLDRTISEFRYGTVPLDQAGVGEAIAFLEWLRDNNFTFLGMREFSYRGGERATLMRTEKEGLGILADPNVRVLRRGMSGATTTPEVLDFLHGPDPLIVTKANAKSVVHRRAYLDYVGVKTFTPDGKLAGELRIVGLFTSTAYTRSVMTIPYLRSKAQAVIAASGFDPADHSGKTLINVLESYPRDELFQIGVETLQEHAEAIMGLVERPRVRALVRRDRFDRFVSVIVFVPRDRYDSVVRERIGLYLKDAFEGRVSAYYPAFPEGGLARVHFIIGRSGGAAPEVAPAVIEAAIRDIVRTWDDALAEAAARGEGDPALVALASRFPESYRGSFTAVTALLDARYLAAIDAGNPIAVDYYRDTGQTPEQASLKIYHHGSPVALSRRVPLLENMGFRVISERTFELAAENGGAPVFIHDMELENAFGAAIDLAGDGELLERVFLSIWHGEADNDGYNALAQSAGLDVPAIGVLRAYGRYLQQAGIPQGQEFVAAVLSRYPAVARDLWALFRARLEPRRAGDREAEASRLIAGIKEALEGVPSLDDDTILRRYLNLVEASVRTNHFAPPSDGPCSLAVKLDPRKVDGLPEPRPWREIFVYGPEVEGVHLRFGPVARGGLRWSDRAQDYRTEVLGLVKAQQVKNAVIVPVGAKGGFLPKRLPAGGSRDAVFEAGKAAYVNFVSSMLSVTDNIEGDHVVPPTGAVRRDGDDPYFVVAADKGTATFSDTANAISQRHNFWLDDAFASGGSAGYDHKKMGITARGGWEAVKRHFREMNRDIQTSPVTVVGVGDMSGDVFGNGMLLSDEIRLVAAFDHRDIFIDPDPDPAKSMAERRRLFALPRSSWQDFDKSALSRGGMIIPRTQKSVDLSTEAAAAIGLGKTTASPAEIMKAILKAEVDLLWFGGIGTYVRASSESNQDVGDRANDAIRVTGLDVRAKVIGEGANLGMTQRGRIEFSLAGGRCNSDAIDNSAGVNSSDVEVNIKIGLATAMRAGALTRPDRDALLASMTPQVAALVLANNYGQTLALSVAEKTALADMPHHARFMATLEARGQLDRAVESLPTPAQLAERETRRQPLTRPEIGVLLAYAKIVLFSDIVASDVPDDPHFEADLLGYFPAPMAEAYAAEIKGHRLRREIIARVVANDLIDRGGPAFVTRLCEATGATAAEVVRAYTTVSEGFELPAILAGLNALDNRIDGQAQLDLFVSLSRVTLAVTGWFLRNSPAGGPLAERVGRIRQARRELEPQLAGLLPEAGRAVLEGRRAALEELGVPGDLAGRIAHAEFGTVVPDIMLVAESSGATLDRAAHAFFAVTEAFGVGRVAAAAAAIVPGDYYDGLALARAAETVMAARRGIASAALSGFGEAVDPVAEWLAAGGEPAQRTRQRLADLTGAGELGLSRLAVAAGLMSDLAKG